MNKWKVAFFISLPITVLSLIFSFFIMIDNGVSYTYLEVSYQDQVRANEVLGNLIVQGGQQYNQKDFLHLLRQAYPERFIVEEGSLIKMDSNIFKFENNRIIKAE